MRCNDELERAIEAALAPGAFIAYHQGWDVAESIEGGPGEDRVAEIQSEHRSNTGFMPGFEQLAQGRALRGPSFTERAQARWSRRAGGGGGAP